MPLIRLPDVEPRDAVSVRLERRLHERLQQFVAFSKCPKHYVVARALEQVFRTDKEFAAWLAARADHASTVDQMVDRAPVGETPEEHAAASESAVGDGAPVRRRRRA